jgi:hypothetical protein
VDDEEEDDAYVPPPHHTHKVEVDILPSSNILLASVILL